MTGDGGAAGLRNGTGFVGQRTPTLLAPGLSSGLRWALRLIVLFGYAAGPLGLLLGFVSARQGLGWGPALGLTGFGAFFLGTGEWTRRLLANDASLRSTLTSAWGSWGEICGGRMGYRELAALDVTPWGILQRNDVADLLRRAAVAPRMGQPHTAIEVLEAVGRLVAGGGRPGLTNSVVAPSPPTTRAESGTRADGQADAPMDTSTNRTIMVLVGIVGAGLVGVFGWRLVANILRDAVPGAIFSALLCALGVYLVSKALRHLQR